MNNRKIILIILISSFILLAENKVYGDFDLKLDQINDSIFSEYNYVDYYQMQNSKNKNLNITISQEYLTVAYGFPSGGKFSNLTNKYEHRYLGEANIGQMKPNYNYAYDTKSKIYFDDMYWIKDPWEDSRIVGSPSFNWMGPSHFNAYRNTTQLLQSFMAGMHYQHGNPLRPAGDWFRGDTHNKRGELIEWHRYMHIIDPPTFDTHGSAMLWHISELDNKLYYIDVRLTRFKDLETPLHVRHKTIYGGSLSEHDYTLLVPVGGSKTVQSTPVEDLTYRGYGITIGTQDAPLQSTHNQLVFDSPLTIYQQNSITPYTITFYYEPKLLSGDAEHGNIIPQGIIQITHSDYDVTKGIPTGELVQIQADVDSPLLIDYAYETHTGEASYSVEVHKPYTLHWEEYVGRDALNRPVYEARSYSDVHVSRYTITRPYTYFTLRHLSVDALRQIDVYNVKLSTPNPVVLLAEQLGYKTPTVHHQKPSTHIDRPDSLQSNTKWQPSRGLFVMTLGESTYNQSTSPTYDFSTEANSALGALNVRNDSLSLNDTTLLNGNWHNRIAPQGVPLTAARELVAPITLTLPSYLIPHTSENGMASTLGRLHYQSLARVNNSAPPRSFEASGNAVFIHTPVVLTSSLHLKEDEDQRPEALRNNPAVPLQVIMQLDVHTRGQHITLPGYGNRDYALHTKTKRVAFPFDVYFSLQASDLSDVIPHERFFVGANQWISLPLSSSATYFKVPHWVDEGDYSLLMQSIAHNHRTPARYGMVANLNPNEDIAADMIPVTVVGKLYEFKLTHTADFKWSSLYNQLTTAKALNISLPLMPGKHPQPGYQQAGIKLGYPVRFTLKTMGNYFSSASMLYLRADFFRIDPKTNTREPVDLYYRIGQKYVKIGSDGDVELTHTTLQNGRYELLKSLIDATATAISRLSPQSIGQTSKAYLESTKKATYTYKPRSALLSFALSHWMGMHENLPPSVASHRAFSGEQLWYGEYALPDSTIVVKKGASLQQYYAQEQTPYFTDGYLAVNMSISTHKEQHLKSPQLLYISPTANRWLNEGFNTQQYGLTLHPGDVLLYTIGERASDDLNIRR